MTRTDSATIFRAFLLALVNGRRSSTEHTWNIVSKRSAFRLTDGVATMWPGPAAGRDRPARFLEAGVGRRRQRRQGVGPLPSDPFTASARRAINAGVMTVSAGRYTTCRISRSASGRGPPARTRRLVAPRVASTPRDAGRGSACRGRRPSPASASAHAPSPAGPARPPAAATAREGRPRYLAAPRRRCVQPVAATTGRTDVRAAPGATAGSAPSPRTLSPTRRSPHPDLAPRGAMPGPAA